jgi:hypothetical protein
MKLRHLLSRAVLRPLRTLPAARIPFDPHSPEYLYVAQQAKRLSLVRAQPPLAVRGRAGHGWESLDISAENSLARCGFGTAGQAGYREATPERYTVPQSDRVHRHDDRARTVGVSHVQRFGGI